MKPNIEFAPSLNRKLKDKRTMACVRLVEQLRDVKTYLLCYVIIKFALVMFLSSQFERLFGQSYFNYPDLSDNITCDVRAHNGLFSLLLCGMGIGDIQNNYAFSLALFLSTVKDLIIVMALYPFMNRSSVRIFIILLAFHPYLAVYHGKLTTDLFACLSVALFLWMIFREEKKSDYLIVFSPLLSGLRNSVIPFWAAYCFFKFLTLLYSNGRVAFLYLSCGVIVCGLFFLPNENYSDALSASVKTYPLDRDFFTDLLGLSDGWWGQAVSSVSYVSSRIILLLGFREAAFTHPLTVFYPVTLLDALELFVYCSLTVIHAAGLFWFFRHFRDNLLWISFLLLIVFPGFLLVAHMRYFLPLIPVALAGIAVLLARFMDGSFLNRIFKS